MSSCCGKLPNLSAWPGISLFLCTGCSQRGVWQPSCAVQESLSIWLQPHSTAQGKGVCLWVILWRPAVIPVVLVTSWSTSSLTGSCTSLTLLLFWLFMKIAAPGSFFPGMLRTMLPAILCDLHSLLLTMEFGLYARGGRLMNSHSSITSDRAFPCTLQLPGWPYSSRLKYHSMLLSTAVESGSAGGISSSGGWAGAEET